MQSVLHATPDNPVPENHFAGFFTAKDGVNIRYAVFRASASEARGTIVLLQGRNECIEKYYETIADLTAEGLWVATFDWRGQGGSDRLLPDARHGHVRRFSDYEDDLSTFIEQIVLPDTRLPFFLVAHSTGALVALSQAPYLENRIDRMALTAPFLALTGQALGQRSIEIVARLASMVGLGKRTFQKRRRVSAFAGNVLTSDPRRFARNQAIAEAHPELFVGPPTARWLDEALTTISRVTKQDHLTRIRIPTIVLGATADRIVPRMTLNALARKFRAGRLIEIDGAQHELFQEADRYRAATLAAIAAFIPGSDAEKTDFGS